MCITLERDGPCYFVFTYSYARVLTAYTRRLITSGLHVILTFGKSSDVHYYICTFPELRHMLCVINRKGEDIHFAYDVLIYNHVVSPASKTCWYACTIQV